AGTCVVGCGVSSGADGDAPALPLGSVDGTTPPALPPGWTDPLACGLPVGSLATRPPGELKINASRTITMPASARMMPISHGTACSAVVGLRRLPSRFGSQESVGPESGGPP